MSYAEFPFDQIVNVHFGSSGGGGGGPSPPYCGSYGYGEIVEDIGPLITGVPFGPIVKAPFAGTFNVIAPNGINGEDGGLEHPLGFGDTRTTIAGATYGLIPQNMALTDSDLIFTNFQLLELLDPQGHPAPNGWIVPMASGGVVLDPIQHTVAFNYAVSYTIDMEWTSANGDGEVGLAFTSGATPSIPDVVLGTADGGSATYVYDVVPGQTAFLWWMTRREGLTGWTANTQFMGDVLVGLGDNYAWTITASCAIRD